MSTPTPWFDALREKLGEREVPGPASNPWIDECFAACGHPGLNDSTAWCSAAVGWALSAAGFPNTKSLAARSYLKYGRKLDKPEPGCIVVFWRDSPASWQGHVGFYVRDDGTHVRVLGGNQNNAVTEASYSKSQVLGYRMPVKPTVRELRDAGSREITAAGAAQKVAVGAAVATGGAELASHAIPDPATIVVPKVDPSLVNAVDTVSAVQKLMVAVRTISDLMIANRSVLILGACLAALALGYFWKRRRVDKAKAGAPIGVEA